MQAHFNFLRLHKFPAGETRPNDIQSGGRHSSELRGRF
jgi:hypothetical protein